MSGKQDEFIHDVRRVLQAAYNRLIANDVNGDERGIPGTAQRPLHDAQVETLRLAIKGMDVMSYELSSLHYAYRTALVVLGYDRRYLQMVDERRAKYEETGKWE